MIDKSSFPGEGSNPISSSKDLSKRGLNNLPLIPGMPLPNGLNAPIIGGHLENAGIKKQKTAEEIIKELEEKKKRLEPLKKKILKKYKFTKIITVLPEQALPLFAEDEAMPVEIEKTNPILLMMVFPEEHYKEIQKIKQEVLGYVKESKENIWLMLKTEVDLWNYGHDGKYELLDVVAGSFPIYDSGFLGALRIANIHKSLVLRRFDKYVASYVIGGSLVRGTAGEDSDVDTFVVVDDTDVKRMSRIELLERLRGIITNDLIKEATARAGVKNILNVQVYLLTDFWQSVKDANPIMFTFIRDGVPFYDRGTFTPWKLLLKMGKIKPSPEAVDMFMKSGDQTDALLKRRMIDAMIDIYWGVVTPTQALMMLAGLAPPEPKIIVQEVRKQFLQNEKFLTVEDINTLDRIVKLYKDYEHGKLKEISGKEIDELKKKHDDYTKKMKELRVKIERVMREKTIARIYDEVFELLKTIFGIKSREALVEELNKQLVKKAKISKRMYGIAKEIIRAKDEMKKKSLTPAEMQKLTGDSAELINSLTEYSQRKELVSTKSVVLRINYGGKRADVIKTDSGMFFVEGDDVKKFSKEGLEKSSKEELNNSLKTTKEILSATYDSKILDILRKQIGEFEIII